MFLILNVILKFQQTRPSSRPNFAKDDDFSNEQVFMDIKLKGETCPQGTVPIRRSNDDEQQLLTDIRRQSYARLGEQHSNGWSPSHIYVSFIHIYVRHFDTSVLPIIIR